MSPRSGRGVPAPDALEVALAAALAAAAGLAPDAVRVRVEGVRWEDLGGSVELRLSPETAAVGGAAAAALEEGAEVRDERDGREDTVGDAIEGTLDDADDGEDAAPAPADLDAQAEAAADFLEGLLDAFDLDGDLQIRVGDGVAEVEITDAGDGVLIGRRGQTLEAIQELTRSALQRRFQQRSDVVVDVDGYRARRVERLLERTDEAIEDVTRTGEPQRLEPMDAFERKVVHQRVAEAGGLVSNSFGREPGRRVIIERA